MEQEKKDLCEAFKDNVEQLKQTPASTQFPSFGQIENIKKLFADVIDNLNNFRRLQTSSEVIRMVSVAITEAQTAQMWAVKAITWKD